MQTNTPTANIERNADTSRFSKRIGSIDYEVNIRFNQEAKETMNDKILRLIKNEALSERGLM